MLKLLRIAFAALMLTASLIGGVSASAVQPSYAVSDLSMVDSLRSTAQVTSSEHYHYNHGVPEECDQTGIHAHSHCSGCVTVRPSTMTAADFNSIWQAARQSFALPLLIDRIDYPPKNH